ncbi:CorA family divalent cation transporter [Longispora sp. NPDC051575]|uniref:CorA family divalent cation transporter n=1 Tax=Longispora sp. NPDC051575 TaxID=3154943 RepID=UPI00344AE48E
MTPRTQTTTTTPFDAAALDTIWLRVPADDDTALAACRAAHGAVFPHLSDGMEEDDTFIYIPVTQMIRSPDGPRRVTVLFALADDLLITVAPAGFAPFDRALTRMRRNPALTAGPRGVMQAVLHAMNEASAEVVEHASTALEAMNGEIERLSAGRDEKGREIGVTDIQATTFALNGTEELVSRCLEGQLMLARAARYLRMEVNGDDPDLASLVDLLGADIQGVKERAAFEHDKVRFLQQSILASLDVKQNQIVKVFTIITAVFLPPTLIATFYGMNFAVMPELTWEHGFPISIGMTLVAALLPLWYIKQKGWLR